ncbi:MAG: hypothetical protein JNJ45_03300 [Chthonomonas sp.]|nr:hypothetical protein [Chthonomonas sp.]
MISALVLAGTLRYQLAAGTVRRYDFSATFEGFIPILGGQEGKAEVALTVEVTGLAPAANGDSRAQPKISAAEIKFNGGKIPLSVETIAGFFPSGLVEFSPLGVSRPLAQPKPAPPFRLPGLDVNRLAELVFLPIEFSELDAPQWTFNRMVGGSKQETLAQESDDRILLEQTQLFQVMENEALEVVTNPADAVSDVSTRALGKGWVRMDVKAGAMLGYELKTTATSTVKDRASGKTSVRELKSVMKCSWVKD